MKIKVLKDTGLFEIGNIYTINMLTTVEGSFWQIYNGSVLLLKIEPTIFNKWLKNDYIEEVKDVSYAFEDISSPDLMIDYDFEENRWFPENAKQAHQMQAFAKLTHVRAKILKDFVFEGWEPKQNEEYWTVGYDIESKTFDIDYHVYVFQNGVQLKFKTKEQAELALQHNEELFKTYLGV